MNISSEQNPEEMYEFDHQAGPVYGSHTLSPADAEKLARQREVPHVVEVVVWPYPESTDQRPEMRRYYALNLPQAAGRAVEIEIRLREQELRAAITAIRPATKDETNTFFMAMAKLERVSPVFAESAVKERGHLLRIPDSGAIGQGNGRVKDPAGLARIALQRVEVPVPGVVRVVKEKAGLTRNTNQRVRVRVRQPGTAGERKVGAGTKYPSEGKSLTGRKTGMIFEN